MEAYSDIQLKMVSDDRFAGYFVGFSFVSGIFVQKKQYKGRETVTEVLWRVHYLFKGHLTTVEEYNDPP